MSKQIDFILDLLDNKKLKRSDKERVFLLANAELKKLNANNKRFVALEEQLKKLKISESPKESNDVTSTQIKPIFQPAPKPKDVADFMSLFNQRDGLKYLTHDFDEENDFDVRQFLINSYNIFVQTTYKLNVPPSLWKIIEQFAFNSVQAEWTSLSADYNEKRIKLGWASNELQSWSRTNRLHPIRNEKYREVINDFRRITRVESPNLELLVDKCIGNVFKADKSNFVISKMDLSKADFYTHVGFLKAALESIFEEIKQRSDTSEKRKISIQYERETIDDYFVRKIRITHFNSYPTKELNVLLKEWFSIDKGRMGSIGKKLKGYCNWSVETKVEDKPLRVNILKEKATPETEIIDKAVGFTHILIFYYK